LPARPVGLGRPISDREAWGKLAQSRGFAGIVADAEKLMKGPTPEWSDELYLDFTRTGNRERGQKMIGAIRGRFETFALAECLENRGRFIKPLEQSITAICAQPTWVYPAHDGGLRNFRGETIEMDLAAVATAWDLATADYLLGDKLS